MGKSTLSEFFLVLLGLVPVFRPQTNVLDEWFSTCGLWIPGDLHTKSKESAKEDYDLSKVCEYLHLQFKGARNSL